MEKFSEERIRRFQESKIDCDQRKECIQPPIVCLVCDQRNNVRNCFRSESDETNGVHKTLESKIIELFKSRGLYVKEIEVSLPEWKINAVKIEDLEERKNKVRL